MREWDVMFRDERDWVDFGKSYVGSEAFKTLFRDGMAMVEETAAYLDGDGRAESRLIAQDAALVYAGESMRLTTRLMQIASWLLVQRAVSEGELTPAQALDEKRRVKLGDPDATRPYSPAVTAQLPPRLSELIERSRRLHARILHLDELISEQRPTPISRESPVAAQHGLLRSAFDAG